MLGETLFNHDIEEKEEKAEEDGDDETDASRELKLGGLAPGADADSSRFIMEFPMARPGASWGRQFTTLVHRNLLVQRDVPRTTFNVTLTLTCVY